MNGAYYYHSDHLGSAQVVTNHAGAIYERFEYTPYGEVWIEWANSGVAHNEMLPFRFTGKELDEETGLYYYGARYLDPKVSRWLSADPAMGEYIPSAPINEEARRRNGSLPGQGGVFNLVNLHAYHYAGNNPVKYVDPDGRTEIDFESQTIYANLDDIDDLDMANQQLSGFQNTPGYEGFTVTARGQNGPEENFRSFAEMTRYLEVRDPTNYSTGDSSLMLGVGIGVFAIVGIGAEAGVSYSDSNGLDAYLTGGIGYGVGVSSKATLNINKIDGANQHLTTGWTATAGAGLAANFDMRAQKFTGLGGITAGGGILHTGTITVKGLWGNAKSFFSKFFKCRNLLIGLTLIS
jgi:RHS repeat-associated protein